VRCRLAHTPHTYHDECGKVVQQCGRGEVNATSNEAQPRLEAEQVQQAAHDQDKHSPTDEAVSGLQRGGRELEGGGAGQECLTNW